MAGRRDRLRQDQQARASGHRSGGRIPRSDRRRRHRDAVRSRSCDRAEKGERAVKAAPAGQRKDVSELSAQQSAVVGLDTATRKTPEWRAPSYWTFVAPAMIVVLAVIIFPWAYS